MDPWDLDSRHPARGKMAEFGTKTFIFSTRDAEDEPVTVIGEYDYRVDSEGTSLLEVRYWPNDEFLLDDVYDYCHKLTGA